ncbi:hypothetical protein WICMUC_005135 [Wickerhamomyces mucosus]|uniref:Eukaryotic translation initiation factor 3 subunit J n=1 Tax=Wickerhamomyces mucosus TaxID=1378264 RepID=A0A9P8P9K5_9ASCO|nr:hypothetical protein WICMUC_005135 [Wickerhamomyces mucosus]
MSWGKLDDDDFEVPTSTTTKVAESWDDEFADDEPVLESWDAEEEEVAKPKPKPKPASKKATTKVNSTIPQINLDNLDEKTRKELLKKAELESDLNNAADLFGGLGINEHPREKATRLAAEQASLIPKITADTPLESHPLFNPETKQDYEKLKKALVPALTRLADQSALNYSGSLAIDLIRDLTKPLSTENIRKVISTLNVISKDKERQERQARLAKAGGTSTGGAGKKKAKTARPNLGGAFKKDSDVVVDNFDDFGDDDFM